MKNSELRFISWLIFLVALLNSCAGNRSLFNGIEEEFERSPAFENGFTGLMIYDPEENEVLFEHNAHKYFTPASNVKLLTFYTGLKVLGNNIPHLQYSIKEDTLYFSGTGDPSFLNPDLPESPAFDFLKNVPQQLVLVPPVNKIEPLGPGWAWDDYSGYYSAERSAFPVYGNLVHFSFRHGEPNPEVNPGTFRDSLVIVVDRDQNAIKRKLIRNHFFYGGNSTTKGKDQKVPFITSAEITASLLADTLDRSIRVYEGRPKMAFQKLSSAAITDTIYIQMLQESDNLVAEQILLMASHYLGDTLDTGKAIDYMQENYLKDLPNPVIWVDGSGLSRYNLVTPASMVEILKKIKEEVPYEKLFEMLPSGGKTGTLKNRFVGEEPFIFAKTGSLSNNHSLSGYLKTKKGKILIFSFMNSNYVVPSSVLRANMDRLLTEIRDRY